MNLIEKPSYLAGLAAMNSHDIQTTKQAFRAMVHWHGCPNKRDVEGYGAVSCNRRSCPSCGPRLVHQFVEPASQLLRYNKATHSDFKIWSLVLTVDAKHISQFPRFSDIDQLNKMRFGLEGDQPDFELLDAAVGDQFREVTKNVKAFFDAIRRSEALRYSSKNHARYFNGKTLPSTGVEYVWSCGFGSEAERFHIHAVCCCSLQALVEALPAWAFGKIDFSEAREVKDCVGYTITYGLEGRNGFGRVIASRGILRHSVLAKNNARRVWRIAKALVMGPSENLGREREKRIRDLFGKNWRDNLKTNGFLTVHRSSLALALDLGFSVHSSAKGGLDIDGRFCSETELVPVFKTLRTRKWGSLSPYYDLINDYSKLKEYFDGLSNDSLNARVLENARKTSNYFAEWLGKNYPGFGQAQPATVAC
jgi:hypothetical protein